MFEVVIASGNKKKKEELKAILKELRIEKAFFRAGGVNVLDLNDFPEIPKIKEKGVTFEENAVDKAVRTAGYTGRMALADDSGLEVDILGGRPGVYSARFAGNDANDEDNNRKLLKLLEGRLKKERAARFVCVIAVADKNGLVGIARGECRGWIEFAPKGKNGFGYDPLFVYRGYDKTFAQIGAREKNLVSHRSRALKKAAAIINRRFRKVFF